MLVGCAYGRAIDRGHDYVAQSRWRDALAEFDRARTLDPGEEEAQRLYERSIPPAIAEAKRAAGEAVAAGRYEDAVKLAAYVEELDPEEGKGVRTSVARWMRAAVEGLIAEQKMEVAYPLALRAKKLFATWTPIDDQLVAIRDHYLKRSDAAFETGDFAGALAALDAIEAHEPARAPLHAERRARTKSAWADREASRGRAMSDAGHPGAAAAHYARAYDIAGRPADRDAMRVQLASLEEHGMFTVALELSGDPRRTRVERDAERRLGAVAGVHVASSAVEEASMVVRLDAAPVRCHATTTVGTDSVRYQSGTRDVPNPAFQKLERTIAARGREVERHARREAEARTEAARTHARAQRCGAQTGHRESALRDAERAAAAAARESDAQRERVERLERRLEEATPERKKRLRRRLRKARETLRDVEAAERTAQEARDRARRDLESRRRECGGVTAAHERAVAAMSEHRADREAAQRDVERAESRRAHTPATVEEPVFSSFEFDVRHVTRTCAGPLVVDIEPAWRADHRELLEHARDTEDTTHAAYPDYGVAADPLELPASDAQLIDAVDARAAQAVVELVGAHVRDYYASMVDRAAATARESPHLATDMMLALWTAGPEHLDAQDRATIAAHLDRHYQVADLERIAH